MPTRQTPPRGHAKRPPEPLIFPMPKVDTKDTEIPHPDLETGRLVPFPNRTPISVELRNYIAHCIAITLHKVADWPIAEMQIMSEAEFEALCRSILEDDA